MRTAVTGGAGFIGSHIVDLLVKAGHEVLVIDDLSRGSVKNIQQSLARTARLDALDVRDGAAVTAAFRSFKPEFVFHLAAQIDVRVSMTDPAWDAATNVVGSVSVLAAAAATGVRRVINTSTGGAIYGETEVVPTPETAPTNPASAYGLSKRTAEQYGGWFRATHGLDVVTLRYGNVYGPRQNPGGDAGVIAIMCDRMLRGERPLVFGDGRQTRDFVFVADVAAANVAAAQAVMLQHREYNIGTGIEVSVLELVEAVTSAAGVDPGNFAPEFAAARAGEVRRSCLDVSRAQRELLLPSSTPLRDGIASTLAWVADLHADSGTRA